MTTTASDGRVEALLEMLRAAGSEAERAAALEALEGLAREAQDRDELVARAQREAARIRYLAHAGALLASTMHPHDTLATLASLAVPHLADWAAVDLFRDGPRVERLAVAHVDPEKVALVTELSRRHPPQLDDPADGLGQILRTGQPQIVPELPPGMLEAAARDEDHLRIMRSLGLRSYVCVPIASRGRVRGALSLIAAESGRRFSTDDLELALEIARRASIALDVAEVMEELRAAERRARDASERLERASRRKDEFLAMLGHELRNPLAAIATASELLRLRTISEDASQRAREAIGRQVLHMKRMLDDLLDVARVARGKIRLDRQPVDLGHVVRQTINDQRAAFDSAEVELVVEVPAAPSTVVGDPTRLTQIVANVLHNARKFTPAGGRVSVRLTATGQALELVVADTGQGIAPEALSDLFEPFVQERRSYDRSESGLGLGLALARGLVERHGGTIAAASEGVGRGATFTVRLPRAEAETSAVEHEAGLRVLVVEDDPDAGDMTRLLLEALGHRVELATDGPSALARARALRPELVLCDIGLPGGMDGYAVARALRGAAEAGDPMLVAVTGFGLPDHVRRAEDAGFDRFATKPLAADALAELIEAASRRPM